jgi:hypothetical protein
MKFSFSVSEGGTETKSTFGTSYFGRFGCGHAGKGVGRTTSFNQYDLGTLT